MSGILFGLGHWLDHKLIRPFEQKTLPPRPIHVLIIHTKSEQAAQDGCFTEIRLPESTALLQARHDESTNTVLGCLAYFCNVVTEPRNSTGTILADCEDVKATIYMLRATERFDLKKYYGDTLEMATQYGSQAAIISYTTLLSIRGEVPLPSWTKMELSPLDDLLTQPKSPGLAFITVSSLHATEQKTSDDLDRENSKARFRQGAPELIRMLKKLGFNIVVFGEEGSTSRLAAVQEDLGLDRCVVSHTKTTATNKNSSEQGEGRVTPSEDVRRLLLDMCNEEQVHESRTIVIGSHHDDRLMLEEAGLGIAYHADQRLKSITHSAAERVVTWDSQDMRDVLFLFGFSHDEVAKLAG